MKIQHKRSNLLENGAAKQPSADQMEYGELAVNYNEADPALFLKNSNNEIVRIADLNGEVTDAYDVGYRERNVGAKLDDLVINKDFPTSTSFLQHLVDNNKFGWIAPGVNTHNGTDYNSTGGMYTHADVHSIGINKYSQSVNNLMSLASETSVEGTSAAKDIKYSKVPLSVTVKAAGPQHGTAIRGDLTNLSTDGDGNAALYGRATSYDTAFWSAAIHGETRHNGGTSIGISSENASFTTDGTLIGVSSHITTGGPGTHPESGTQVSPVTRSYAYKTTGSAAGGNSGRWSVGLLLDSGSIRPDNGRGIQFKSDMQIGIDLSSGTYSNHAIKFGADQTFTLEGSDQIYFGYTSSNTAIEFKNGSNVNLAINNNGDVSIRGDLTVDGTISYEGKQVNVKDFGAKGDSVTDDTAAIQAAIDTGAGVVFFPEGTYISGQLILPTRCILEGESLTKTIIRMKDNSNGVLIKSKDYDALVAAGNKWLESDGVISNSGLRTIQIDGNKANNSAGDGVRLYCKALVLESVIVRDCPDNGISTIAGDIPGQEDWQDLPEGRIHNVWCRNNGQDGWYFRGPHDSRISGFTANENGRDGMNCDRQAGVYSGVCDLAGVHIYANGRHGFYTNTNGTCSDFISESNNSAGAIFDGWFYQGSNMHFYKNQRGGSTSAEVRINGSKCQFNNLTLKNPFALNVNGISVQGDNNSITALVDGLIGTDESTSRAFVLSGQNNTVDLTVSGHGQGDGLYLQGLSNTITFNSQNTLRAINIQNAAKGNTIAFSGTSQAGQTFITDLDIDKKNSFTGTYNQEGKYISLPDNGRVSVKDFGAVGDGVTDDTVAINNAIAYCKALLAGGERSSTGNGVVLSFSGDHLVTDPINLTEIRPGFNFTINGNGATINGEVSGGVVLDMTGSKRLILKDFTIWSDDATAGIILGRSSADTADMHSFYNVNVQGAYSFAAIYNFASEHVSYYDCFFFNDYDEATSDRAYVVVNDSYNAYGITSRYTTSAATNTFASFNASQYTNCKFFRRSFKGNDSLGPCIQMDESCQKHYYRGCYAVAGRGNAVRIHWRNTAAFTGGWKELKGLHLDLHIEKYGKASTLDYAVEFNSEDTDADVVAHDFVYYDNNPHVKVGLFRVTSPKSVTILNGDVSIIDVTTATQDIQFAQALNRLNFFGKIAIPGYASPRRILLQCFGNGSKSMFDCIYRGADQAAITTAINNIPLNSEVRIYNMEQEFVAHNCGLPEKADLPNVQAGCLYVDTDDANAVKRKV